MTDRIDDLIQRLMERDFEVEGVPCITLTNAIRKIREWAGEQQPDLSVDDAVSMKTAMMKCGISTEPSNEITLSQYISMARQLSEKVRAGLYSDITPQPVADGCDCGRTIDEHGNQVHYLGCSLYRQPVAGELRERVARGKKAYEWLSADQRNRSEEAIHDLLEAYQSLALLRPEPGLQEALHFLRCVVNRPDAINLRSAKQWLDDNFALAPRDESKEGGR